LRKSYLGCVLAAALCCSASVAAAGAPEVKPANDFSGIGYTVSSSGAVVVYAGLREISSKVAVCGIVWFEKTVSNTTKVIEVKFTDQIKFSAGGKALRVNSRLFKRYDSEVAAKAGMARCSVTATPWSAAYAKSTLKLTMGNIRVTD
jgi:hypothetical protein